MVTDIQPRSMSAGLLLRIKNGLKSGTSFVRRGHRKALFWVSDLVPTSLWINTSPALSQNTTNCLTKPPLGTYRKVNGERNVQSL